MAEGFPRNGGDTLPKSISIDPSNLAPLLKWGVVILSLIILFGVFSFLRNVYTDLLWFDSMGLRSIFVKVTITKILLLGVGTLVVAAILAISLRLAHHYSAGEIELPVPPGVTSILSRVVVWGAVIAIVVLSLIFGSVLSARWEMFLRFTNSVPFGQIDPVFGRDFGFFIFDLPVYSFMQGWILGIGIVTLLATVAIQFINYTLRGGNYELTGARLIHLSIIAAVIMLTIAVGHWLDRWALVQSEDGYGFGAFYTDLNARKPALVIMTIVAVAAGVLMLVNTYVRQMRIVIGAVALWIVLGIVLGTAWPGITQRVRVEPQQLARETPYIKRNIDLTRQAFALDRIEEAFYPAVSSEIGAELIKENLQTINNIRLWDYRPLSSVYKQIQLIRPYYDFKDADVDRYTIDGQYRQVLLSAREVAPEKLSPEAQTWVNNKLVYTHGIGIAMSPATEFTPEGRPEFFAKDIPADGAIPIGIQDGETPPSLTIDNPRIYYGENTLESVIVNSNTDELDYQTEQGDLIRTRYAGDGGVELSSFIRRVAYAWQFGDANILISGEITGESRLQYRRAIQERVATVAPFLMLDHDPYIVAADGKLSWIQDAYTVTDQYPYSDPLGDPNELQINYMRNSVKVTINAYDGSLGFYIWDTTDPIVLTYQRIFPKLFRNADEMPEGLQSHVRYPQDFFSIQAEKYIRYHMQDPQNFYNDEDLWARPNEKFGQGDDLQVVEPYYVIMKLPGEDTEEFVQLLPYTPNERQNLIGWLAARSDGENYGKLLAFNFPKDRQIDGPEQVEARIDNDQDIAAWFTLRCAEGSICIRGNLLVIPLGDSLLYAEPVYIQAQGVEFPELKRVILATAHAVVMEDSLGLALAELTGDQSLVTVGGSTTTRPKPPATVEQVDANPFRQQVNILSEIIAEIKDSLASLEESLEKLKEISGGE